MAQLSPVTRRRAAPPLPPDGTTTTQRRWTLVKIDASANTLHHCAECYRHLIRSMVFPGHATLAARWDRYDVALLGTAGDQLDGAYGLSALSVRGARGRRGGYPDRARSWRVREPSRQVRRPLPSFAGALGDETGSGALVFATSPVLTTPNRLAPPRRSPLPVPRACLSAAGVTGTSRGQRLGRARQP